MRSLSGFGSLAVGLLAAACGVTAPTVAPLLRLRIALDTTAIAYGDPIAWRLDLENVSGDTVGLQAGDLAEGFGYELIGPRGAVPQVYTSALVLGPPSYLPPGGCRRHLEHVYGRFLVDTSIQARVLPVLDAGRYRLRVLFTGSAIVHGEPNEVEVAGSADFSVVPPDRARFDTIRAAADRFLSLTEAYLRGNTTAQAVADDLTREVREAGDALWVGPLVYEVRAVLLARAPYSAALDSTLQDAVEDIASAHPSAAFADLLVPSLAPARRQRWCAAANDGRNLNAMVACGDTNPAEPAGP